MSPLAPPPPSRRAWLAGALGVLAAGRAGAAAAPALRVRHEWRWNAGAPLGAAPTLGGDGRVALATVEGTVQVLGPDGAHALTWVLSAPAAVSPALGARGEVFAASTDGRVVALHADEGLRWSQRLAPAVGRLLAAPSGHLIVLGRDGALVMVSPRGRVVRRVALGRPRAGPVLAPHRVVAGVAGGVVLAVDPEGRLRRERLGGRFTQEPSVAADGTLLAVMDDDLVVLEPESWRERFTRRGVASAAFTPDGLVVRERAEGSLLWLDRRGAVVARAAPGAAAAPGITALGAAALIVERGALAALHPGGDRLTVIRGATYPWAPAVDLARSRVVLGTATGGVESLAVEVAPWT